MKKKCLIAVFVTVILPLSLTAGERFAVQAGVSGISPADSNYKDIYGNTQFLPEFRGRFTIWEGITLWAGYGFYSASGTTPSLGWEATSKQDFLSAGLAYVGKFSGRLGWFAGAGLTRATYKEEALDDTVNGSALGYHVEGGLLFFFSKRLFTSAYVGYVHASDNVEGVSIKLGGLKFGIGIGLSLF